MTLRGGICGCAMKAMPSSPKSARQTAFQVADRLGLSRPSSSAPILRRGRRDHGFDHEAGLRHADRHRRLADRRDRHAHADGEDVREGRVALVLVDEDEAARIGQALDAGTAGTPRNAGSIMEKAKGSSWLVLTRAVLVDLLDEHLAGLDLVDPGVGDPLDVPLAHGALQQALGVADAVEAEMADVGLRRDEGHRHLVAHLGAAQRRVEDEGELVGRAEAGRALHRADDHRAGLVDERVELRLRVSAWSIWQIDWVWPSARGRGSRRRRDRARWR